MHPTEKQLENQYIIYDSSIVDDVGVEEFDIASYKAKNTVLGEASGRGATYFVKRRELSCVLRHYHRGGMMASISKDRYWWTGVYNTRSWREWYLLVKLKDWDLPVPRAIAARAVRRRRSRVIHAVTTVRNRRCRRIRAARRRTGAPRGTGASCAAGTPAAGAAARA